MSDVVIFVYVNTKNIVRIQSINDISENEDYIQGKSLLEDEFGKLKTFRKDRVVKYVKSIKDGESLIKEGIETGDFVLKKETKEIFDICFTGFIKSRRAELESLAKNNNILVRKTVSNNLKLLCYGYNAGPSKLSLARKNGAIILDENEFICFIESGEIPE
ncbi:TPA: hypothetical protein ACKP7A_000894 [Serratia liquefaciens]|jgi:NAD-dependent DNA ligase|uniref:BRCT domain-containing protein n=1 Tax=Serratia proteamaculans TaxID=28151 RepID=A0ABS0U299_SERPR|nr:MULTISPECIES: hypothetical protein [Serratia]MBI6183671.1 hypothetical protein [Serratia proteamaculans]MDU4172419.1 hypothetical protein [Serratia liquefaciens]